jgi:acetyl-CoA/propionyl-CoA carboxylase biotin carboxyl carrier protein
VRDPAFAPADGAPFSVYTRWIETDFDNTIEPWSGALEDPAEAPARHTVVVEVGGKRIEVSLPEDLAPAAGASSSRRAAAAPARRKQAGSVDTSGGGSVTSPMQATVVKLAVEEGQQVVKGDLLLVLEAMKMEQPLTAHTAGTVTGLAAEVGQTVPSGHRLLDIV